MYWKIEMKNGWILLREFKLYTIRSVSIYLTSITNYNNISDLKRLIIVEKSRTLIT